MHLALIFIAVACVLIVILVLFPGLQISNYYELSTEIEASIIIVFLVLAAIVAWIIFKAVRANLSIIKTGKEALIGSVGLAVTDLKPDGNVRVVGEFWQASAEGGWIKNGEKVKVIDIEGMHLIVIPVKEKLNSIK